MKKHAILLAAIGVCSIVAVSACGSDDALGVNECSYVAEVTGLKEVYVIGEVSERAIVTLRPLNPSASCDPGVSTKPVSFGTSDPSIASLTPLGQVVALKPGVVTLTFAVNKDHPTSRTITVIAAAN